MDALIFWGVRSNFRQRDVSLGPRVTRTGRGQFRLNPRLSYDISPSLRVVSSFHPSWNHRQRHRYNRWIESEGSPRGQYVGRWIAPERQLEHRGELGQ